MKVSKKRFLRPRYKIGVKKSGIIEKEENLSKGTCPILHGKEGSSLFVLDLSSRLERIFYQKTKKTFLLLVEIGSHCILMCTCLGILD